MTELEKHGFLKDILEEYYINPTKNKKCEYVGVELEFPIIKLNENVNLKEVTYGLLFHIKEKFKQFELNEEEKKLYDKTPTNDMISFEYSINTLEFSMGKSLNLLETKERFISYIKVVQEYLNSHGCIISGLGLNPNWKYTPNEQVASEYYSVLNSHLRKSINFPRMHDYYDFFSYICSVQTHLDVPYENICEVIKLFSFLSMIKGSLFSNSFDVTGTIRPIYENCCRDYLYHNSMLSFHKKHVSYYDNFDTIEDLMDDMKLRTIYYVKRDNNFVIIPIMTLEKYFGSDKILGISFKDKKEVVLAPEKNDIIYFRSYKPAELTRRGTLEIRDDCQQPISECFVPSAFSLGILINHKEAKNIALEMCREMRIDYLDFRSNRALATSSISPLFGNTIYKKYLKKFLECSRSGLLSRNNGEEKLLGTLENRADILECPAMRLRKYLDSGKNIDYIIKEYSKI